MINLAYGYPLRDVFLPSGGRRRADRADHPAPGAGKQDRSSGSWRQAGSLDRSRSDMGRWGPRALA